jgi:hypothetical protein
MKEARDILAEAPEPVECAICRDYSSAGVEVHAFCAAEARSALAALSEKGWTLAPVEGLDAAWAAAEAALPEGWTLDVGDSLGHPHGRFEASAEEGGYVGPGRDRNGRAAYGETPAAALRGLTDRLRALTTDTGRNE